VYYGRNLPVALMMEAARTSETSVNFYQTTRRYNPEDSQLSKIILRVEGRQWFSILLRGVE
jgi:hypothetical protein